MCFPMKFAKILRALILKSICERVLLMQDLPFCGTRYQSLLMYEFKVRVFSFTIVIDVILVSPFVNFENISHIVFSFFSVTDFEEVNIGCENRRNHSKLN